MFTLIFAALLMHVPTWIYAGFDGYNSDWPAPTLAHYATFAEFSEYDLPRAQAYKTAGGLHAVVYIDPSLVPYCSPPFSPPAGNCRGPFGDQHPEEDAWFHQADGERVHRADSYTGEYQEALNPASARTQHIVHARTERIAAQAPIDLFFADDSGSSLTGGDGTSVSGIFYGFEQAGIEITSDAAWMRAEGELLATLARPAILNGGDITTWLPSYGGAFLLASNVAGASREGCFSNDASGPMSTAYNHWQLTANALLATTALQRYAVCMEVGTPTPSLRIYDFASWLLTYTPRWSVLAPIWTTSNHHNVYPEILVVPEQPLSTPTDGIDQLEENDVYVRRFATCKSNGIPIGSCAIVVNPNQFSATIPAELTHYRYALHLDNRTIDQNPSVSWNVWNPHDALPPISAIILST